MHTAVHFIFGASTPSERWREAFPNGKTLSWPLLSSELNLVDEIDQPIFWVSTQGPWMDIIKWAVAAGKNLPVVVVSSDPNDAQALEVFDAGAKGYCHALSVPALQQDVQRTVASGGLWVGADLLSRMMRITRGWLNNKNAHALRVELSAREAEVTQAVLQGLSNKEVARKLNITERTVKAHLGAVFEKLGVRDRLQMVLALGAPAPEIQESQ